MPQRAMDPRHRSVKPTQRPTAIPARLLPRGSIKIPYDEVPDRKRRRRLVVWLLRGGLARIFLALIFLLVLYLTILQPFTPSDVIPAEVAVESLALPSARSAMGRSATPMARAAAARHRLTAKAEAGGTDSPPPGPSGGLVAERVRLPNEVMRPTALGHAIRNGRLEVDPTSTIHPVYQLIRDARKAWDAKVARQSTTLKQAVEEYERRYRRAPPPGFDKWWHYVVDNNVQLPDEYDQIDSDLALFHALSPSDIRRRVAKAASQPDTFTIKVRHGLLRSSTSANSADELHMARREGQLDLIRPIAKYLPDMTVVYSVHDTPSNFVSHQHKQELLDHIMDDEYLDEDDEPDRTLRGWGQACPRTAPLRSFDQNADLPEISDEPGDKSFIVDHKANMDPCANPELVRLHGLLSSKNPAADDLSAMFAISKTYLHPDVLGVPPERVTSDVPLVPWEYKTEAKAVWRGTNTGMHFSGQNPWRDSHRARLMDFAADRVEGEARVLGPPGLMGSRTVSQSSMVHDGAEANQRYFDIAFVDGPIQCSEEDGSCDALADEYPYRERIEPYQADRYKYVVDVDGNAWSARFQRLLMSGSLVFKSTIMPEWYNDRIQPWVHYVPTKLDYSDLRDALAFFAGDIEGEGGRDDLAEEIGTAGRKWAQTFYRKEDMVAYVFRLYLEWARLQAPDRRSMAFKYGPSMEPSA